MDDSGLPPEEINPGDPIPQLRGLEMPTRSDFDARLADRLNTNEIHLRTVEFTLAGTTWVLLEYLGLVFGAFSGPDDEERGA